MSDGEQQYTTGPGGERRLKNKELVFPIAIGSCAFYLGKKAREDQTHRWTLYVRGVQNEDITHIVTKATFILHPTFQNPRREIAQPPFELTEHGWGEFELSVVLTFAPDAHEAPLELYHKLKLYDDLDPTNQSTKKPVVNEQFEELVFSEPAEGFYQRVAGHVPRPAAPPLSIAACVGEYDPGADMHAISAARQKVAAITANIQRQLDAIPGG